MDLRSTNSSKSSPNPACRSSRRRNVTNLAVFLLPALMVAVGHFAYRPPEPLPTDAPEEVGSAGRARAVLEAFVGDPPVPHPAGSRSGRAAVERLESLLGRMGLATARIVTDMPAEMGNGRGAAVPEGDRVDDGQLVNLLVTLSGSDVGLKPLVIATHHDSHPAAPGGGDSGIGVASLVEALRVINARPRRRTVHGLFTDGEEYGLLGAASLIEQDALPFDEPAFVLNFDARGVRGPSLMYETSGVGSSASQNLLDDLARPRIATSLAAAVYERLDNATDFNVWRDAGWSGFNFAANEGADHYHRPTDTPARVSDRTMQHTIDHMLSMHAALDRADDVASGADGRGGVWFDVLGWFVVRYPAWWQTVTVATIFGGILIHRDADWRSRGRGFVQLVVAVMLTAAMGWIFRAAYAQSDWAAAKYTPLDRPLGLTAMAAGWIAVQLVRVRVSRPVDVWFTLTAAGMIAATRLPSAAYLLAVPVVVWGAASLLGRFRRVGSWAGWLAMTVMWGGIASLLVVALGPKGLMIYPVFGGLIAVVTPRPAVPNAA